MKAAITDKAYVSSIDFLDKREILKEVLDITGEASTIIDIMEMTGRFVQADQPEYHHFVNDYIFQSGIVTAIDVVLDGADAGATNNKIKITVATVDELPIPTELVMFPNERIGYVEAVDQAAKTFTARALSDADADCISPVATAVNVADVCIYFSSGAGEGTASEQDRQPRWSRSANFIQIFKTANSLTELQKVAAMEVEYNGSNRIMFKLQHDTLLKQRMKIAFGLLSGKKAKFTGTDGKEVYLTQGLWHYIKGGDGSVSTTGGVVTPLGGAAVTKAKFRTMSRALDKKGAPKEYWGWLGGDLNADLEEIFHGTTSINAGGGILYNSWGSGNGSAKALDLGVKSVQMYGRTWHIKTLEAFDLPELYGAAGFNFGGAGFFIPTGKIRVDHGSKSVERLRVRYLSGDGSDLKYIENKWGKLFGQDALDRSLLGFSYESVMGLEALGISHFALMTK